MRPVRMDHDRLVAIARRQDGSAKVSPVNDPLGALDGSKATSPAQSLYCFSCHSNRTAIWRSARQQCAMCHSVSTWKITGLHARSRVAGQEHARVEQCYPAIRTDAWLVQALLSMHPDGGIDLYQGCDGYECH